MKAAAAGTHDLIVVGASTGGVEALCTLASSLPGDLGAAVLVVMHIGPRSFLSDILSRCGPLAAHDAKDHERLRRGRIYVAPPSFHMIVRDGHIALTREAPENRHRPAIDPLFRSAARTYRHRVVGIVLSGALDDGTAGLFTVKKRGGISIVQDPADAVMPAMPLNALRHAQVDHCLPIDEIGAVVAKLAGRNRKGAHLVLRAPKHRANSSRNIQGPKGEQVHFACPECSGPMFAIENGKMLHFHCNVGHAYSPESLSEAHTEALERAIWIAIRALRERSAIQESLSKGYRATEKEMAARLKATAKAADRDADLLEEILERL